MNLSVVQMQISIILSSALLLLAVNAQDRVFGGGQVKYFWKATNSSEPTVDGKLFGLTQDNHVAINDNQFRTFRHSVYLQNIEFSTLQLESTQWVFATTDSDNSVIFNSTREPSFYNEFTNQDHTFGVCLDNNWLYKLPPPPSCQNFVGINVELYEKPSPGNPGPPPPPPGYGSGVAEGNQVFGDSSN